MQAQPAISPKQLAANRANAQASTGPRTREGKATSSLNALRTGLTGKTIMLSAAEADAYELHVARFACDFNPVGERETELVQLMADSQWRLNSIPGIEYGFYAAGRVQFAELFADQPDELRPFLIQHHTYVTYQRQISNLSVQEARLRRNYAKDLTELAALQAQRKQAENAAKPLQTRIAPENGFVFSSLPPAVCLASSTSGIEPASMLYPHANMSAPDPNSGETSQISELTETA